MIFFFSLFFFNKAGCQRADICVHLILSPSEESAENMKIESSLFEMDLVKMGFTYEAALGKEGARTIIKTNIGR